MRILSPDVPYESNYFRQLLGQIVEVHLRRGDPTRPITGKLAKVVREAGTNRLKGLEILGPVRPDGTVQVHFVAYDAISHLSMVSDPTSRP